MITVKDADNIISRSVPAFGTEMVGIDKAYGRVLQENIFADRDLPPFDKALMDGIAVKYESFKKGIREFKIEGVQAAGQAQKKLRSVNSCFEIMTGAVVPHGCDCVIPIENVRIESKIATVKNNVSPQQNIRYQGSDHRRGEKLLSKETILLSPQLAIVASVGKTQIKVTRKPGVAVISTGDEIVPINKSDIRPFEIRQSNSHFIKWALDQTHLFESTIFHFQDNKKLLLNKIKNILKRFDILVLTGGVSMGKFDYVPQVLKELGVKVLFHKVKQRPGKPFWFGKRGSKIVFALPGNPVSTQIGTYRYVIPQLKKSAGVSDNPELAVLKKEFKSTSDFTIFLPVKIRSNKQAQLEATAILTGGSGDFGSLGNSDGFIELPAGPKILKAGFVGQIYRWQL